MKRIAPSNLLQPDVYFASIRNLANEATRLAEEGKTKAWADMLGYIEGDLDNLRLLADRAGVEV